MALTKQQMKKMDADLKKHQDTVAKDRDAIEKTLKELKVLYDDCDSALSSLQDARDALSRLV